MLFQKTAEISFYSLGKKCGHGRVNFRPDNGNVKKAMVLRSELSLTGLERGLAFIQSSRNFFYNQWWNAFRNHELFTLLMKNCPRNPPFRSYREICDMNRIYSK
ncbi:hypothetical protein RF11_15037 [Thelohanellus kitauei]|uniref:Uncharacterized protein n=1 Tax=Thelohanellus kitauei TaxID=669202 RepID=A0A0C2J3Z0_THEKT|nr:hypothetical protein RF11_15037 [Thelohanellus kitauei]